MSETFPCPLCEASVARDAQHFPFCSLRCKQRDLGNWLDGVYRIPGAPDEDEEDDDPESYGARQVLPAPEPDGLDED